jgi:hypothetical protein
LRLWKKMYFSECRFRWPNSREYPLWIRSSTCCCLSHQCKPVPQIFGIQLLQILAGECVELIFPFLPRQATSEHTREVWSRRRIKETKCARYIRRQGIRRGMPSRSITMARKWAIGPQIPMKINSSKMLLRPPFKFLIPHKPSKNHQISSFLYCSVCEYFKTLNSCSRCCFLQTIRKRYYISNPSPVGTLRASTEALWRSSLSSFFNSEDKKT